MKTLLGLVQTVLMLIASVMLLSTAPWWSICVWISFAVMFGAAWEEVKNRND